MKDYYIEFAEHIGTWQFSQDEMGNKVVYPGTIQYEMPIYNEVFSVTSARYVKLHTKYKYLRIEIYGSPHGNYSFNNYI